MLRHRDAGWPLSYPEKYTIRRDRNMTRQLQTWVTQWAGGQGGGSGRLSGGQHTKHEGRVTTSVPRGYHEPG